MIFPLGMSQNWTLQIHWRIRSAIIFQFKDCHKSGAILPISRHPDMLHMGETRATSHSYSSKMPNPQNPYPYQKKYVNMYHLVMTNIANWKIPKINGGL
jgi:hypothetical protein